MQDVLMRIDAAQPPTEADAPIWEAGFQRHVRYAGLRAISVVVNGEARQYVAGNGCGACATGGCRPGCPFALFRRLVGALLHGQVVPVRQLAAHAYPQAALAWPGTTGRPLPAPLGWERAQLVQTWEAHARTPRTGVVLWTGAGSSPVSWLQERGWRAIGMPPHLHRVLRMAPLAKLLTISGPARAGLYTLPVVVPDSAGTPHPTVVA